jgi:plastocyanin
LIVGRRTRIFVGLLALAAGGVLPAVAVSETTPTIEAVNSSGYYGEQHHSWVPSVATADSGGSVTFANNSTEVQHGVEWTGTSGQPTPTCTGVPVNSSATNWRGQCTFSHPGTYSFRCTVHPTEMTGTITVNPNGTTTTTTTTPAPGGGGSGPPSSTTNPAPGSPPVTGTSGSPSDTGALTALSVPSRQRGKSVHGSLVVSQAAAGGRLEVTLQARGASLANLRRPPQVRVGRLVRASLHAGTVSFAVPLSAKARHALAIHRRLAVTVTIVLVALHGPPVTATRSVLVTN